MNTLLTCCIPILLFSTSCKERQANSNTSDHPKITTKRYIMRSGYAPVNGIKMYYEEYGSGKPLVLIHGGGSTIETTWGNLIPLLAPDYHVIAVELQAHGRTKDRDTASSFEQDADDVAALLRSLKIEKAAVWGFSNGGNTTMQLAMRHPGLVSKIIVASAFYKREGMQPGFFEGFPNATLKDMPPYLADAFLKVNPDTAGLQAMFDRDKTRMQYFKDWTDGSLKSITVPAMILAGDRDVATNEHTAHMAQLIPGARLLIVPGNHGSYIMEAGTPVTDSSIPQLVLASVNDFLR